MTKYDVHERATYSKCIGVPPPVLLNTFDLDCMPGESAECFDETVKVCEPLVLCKSFDESGVDLLGDHGDLEGAEYIIVENIRGVAARTFCIHFREFAPGDIFHQDTRVKWHAQ